MRKIDRLLQHGLYRSRHGVLLGVCRGIAERFDFSIFWTRAIAVVLLLITGIWPMTGLYLLAALLMRPEPVMPIADSDEQEFYDSYTHSRHAAVQRLKGRFARLERRLRRMEHVVTSAEFDWKERMRS
jgi:phage shock protein C